VYIKLNILLIIHYILEQQLNSHLTVLKEHFPSLKLHIKGAYESDIVFAKLIWTICSVNAWEQQIELGRVALGAEDFIEEDL
jgi:hypothetical protein